MVDPRRRLLVGELDAGTMAIMTMSDGEAVMRSMLAMFATGDVSRLLEVVADDYHDHQGLRGVEIHGPQGFRRVVEAARTGISELTLSIEDLIADGDRVAARIRWQGVSPAGERIDRETIDIVRTAAGKAAEHWGAQA